MDVKNVYYSLHKLIRWDHYYLHDKHILSQFLLK